MHFLSMWLILTPTQHQQLLDISGFSHQKVVFPISNKLILHRVSWNRNWRSENQNSNQNPLNTAKEKRQSVISLFQNAEDSFLKFMMNMPRVWRWLETTFSLQDVSCVNSDILEWPREGLSLLPSRSYLQNMANRHWESRGPWREGHTHCISLKQLTKLSGRSLPPLHI